MTKLFVVGLPREMDEMKLAQLFGPYGDIKLLTIIRDKSNGESKGYAFIQMGRFGVRHNLSILFILIDFVIYQLS